MDEPICEVCGKPLADDPPESGYVMICASCQADDDE